MESPRRSRRIAERKSRGENVGIPKSLAKKSSPMKKAKGKANLLQKYLQLQQTYPMLLGMAQQGLIMAMAKATVLILKAYNSHSNEETIMSVFANALMPLDILKAAVMGGLCMAPLLRLFYSFLDKHVKGTASKTLIDQFIASWFINIYAQFVKAKLYDEPFELLSVNFIRLVMISWLWWIPVKIIMFQYIPLDVQVPFNACGSYVWNIIMFMIS